MGDPGTPQLDWDAIFSQAHRRLIVRLALLAAIGGLGGLLLLGGGLTTEGSVTLGIGPFGKSKVAKRTPKLKLDPKVKAQWQPPPPTATFPVGAQPPKKPPPPPVAPPAPPVIYHPPSCPKGEAYDEQYSDCVPKLDSPEEPDDGAAGVPASTNGGIESPAEAGTAPIEQGTPVQAGPQAETTQ